ncbi:MAG: hypothetical protein ACTSVU_07895 [Promethearchaeota archaeon]
MEIYGVSKIVTGILTCIIGISVGVLEFKRNSKYWLNRFYGFFFIFSAIGFFIYALYHFIFSNAQGVLFWMVTAQIIFNFSLLGLLFSEFVIEFGEKQAAQLKLLIPALIFFISSIFGYFIWKPTLNMEVYGDELVDTHTPVGWLIWVTFYRLAIMIYVLGKYWLLSRRSEGIFKNQLQRLTFGLLFVIFATALTLFGSASGVLGMILEDLGLIGFATGSIITSSALMMKK